MKFGVLVIITIVCVTYVQKKIRIQTLINQILTTYQIFTKLPKILHIYKKS